MNQDDLEEQMKTLMSFKVPESRIRFWREVFMLFVILLSMALGFGLFGLAQWWTCTTRFPDKTVEQCFRFDVEPIKKVKR